MGIAIGVREISLLPAASSFRPESYGLKPSPCPRRCGPRSARRQFEHRQRNSKEVQYEASEEHEDNENAEYIELRSLARSGCVRPREIRGEREKQRHTAERVNDGKQGKESRHSS